MGRVYVPEFEVHTKRTRAGFVPSEFDSDVELWSIWCRSADGEQARRTTFQDLRRLGFVPKKSRNKR